MKYIQMALVLVLTSSFVYSEIAFAGSSSDISVVKETKTIQLKVNQGQLIKLPRAAASVLVANPKIASFQLPSAKSIFVHALSSGSTSLYALDAKDEVIIAIRLEASHDLNALIQQISKEVVGVDVKIVPSSGQSLIVRGKVKTPLQAKQVMSSVNAFFGIDDSENARPAKGQSSQPPRIVNQLKVEQSAQINISVKIVEVSRSLSSDLGLNWELSLKGMSYFINNGTSLFDSATNAFLPTAVAGAVVGGSYSSGSTSIGGLLTALAEDGMATVLAEPNLTTMSGETAGFAAGGEVPIVIITGDNITIDYKQYGVIMRMTPTLLSHNRISLHIAPEVSDLSSEGAVTLDDTVIPAFKVRRTDTTVELASGQSFALAGMLRSSTSNTVTGVAGLRDIPFFGRLFEMESRQTKDTELIIIATAYVVEPVAAGTLKTPGEGLNSLDSSLPSSGMAGYLF